MKVTAENKSESIASALGLLVLDVQKPDGSVQSTGYSFESPIAWTGPGAEAGAGSAADMSLPLALVFAFLGGLILNVMPCVLPVLVMKALSFMKQGASEARERRRDALVLYRRRLGGVHRSYRQPVGAACRGSAVGWGFQLQSPMFVAMLAYVMLALGLNLSGVFVVGGNFGVGQSLASKPGASGAFFTGLLAVVVAAPCTGPFMGAVIGFTLTQPAPP